MGKIQDGRHFPLSKNKIASFLQNISRLVLLVSTMVFSGISYSGAAK